jgi:hypothetical protein
MLETLFAGAGAVTSLLLVMITAGVTGRVSPSLQQATSQAESS